MGIQIVLSDNSAGLLTGSVTDSVFIPRLSCRHSGITQDRRTCTLPHSVSLSSLSSCSYSRPRISLIRSKYQTVLQIVVVKLPFVRTE